MGIASTTAEWMGGHVKLYSGDKLCMYARDHLWVLMQTCTVLIYNTDVTLYTYQSGVQIGCPMRWCPLA